MINVSPPLAGELKGVDVEPHGRAVVLVKD